MGCVHTNVTREGPNGKGSKDLMLKSKPMSLKGERNQRGDRKTYRTIRRIFLKSLIVLLMMSHAMLGK
jgi:hypothetical protein